MYYAIGFGLLIGWWLAKSHTEYLLVIFYHFRYRDPLKYLELYDAQDSEYTFQMMQGQKDSPKNYAQYLLWHQSCRPKASETFKFYWDALVKQMIRDYLILLLLPALLFYRNWLFYVAGVFLFHFGYFIYLHFIKQKRLGFYSIMIQTLIINEIRKKKPRSSQ